LNVDVSIIEGHDSPEVSPVVARTDVMISSEDSLIRYYFTDLVIWARRIMGEVLEYLENLDLWSHVSRPTLIFDWVIPSILASRRTWSP
jgi:hypothetical protein